MRLILLLLLAIFCLQTPDLKAQVLPNLIHTAAATAEPAITATPSAEQANPRVTIRSFLRQMEDYAEGNQTALKSAINCLDLGDIPEFARAEQGAALAVKLHNILSKTKIEFSKVPAINHENQFVLRSDEAGQIILDNADGSWKFSKATIRSIPELFFRLKDQKALSDMLQADPVYSSAIKLRSYIPEVLTKSIFSLEYWQWIGIFLALVLAWIVKVASFWIFKNLTSYLIGRFEAFPAIHSVNGFVLPLAYIAAVYLYHACIYMLDLDPVMDARLLRILLGVKILLLFVFTARAVDLIAEIFVSKVGNKNGTSTQILIPLVRSVLKFILLFVGLVLIASLYSIDLTSVLAGLGIGGIAIALAAKDTVENLFGSITVLLDQPFKVGDFITIEGVSGVVENIGLRSTRLRTPENSLLTIPNSKLISVIVDNLGARRFIRTRLSIGVTYETPIEKLEQFCEGIRTIMANNKDVRPDFFVHFNQFADSSLNILIQGYFLTSSMADHLAKQEQFFFNIIRLADFLGVEFAYPVQRQVTAGQSPAGLDIVDQTAFEDFVAKLGEARK